ncbi:AMP dependent ligase [Histoplasma capsulatum H143]|uniref:AMP dependent ligase n=1 Tax=Ajellomyces capsulatus (strain H143) TaxID=544712 RepID=C6H678_AJECH|nr:AMP dependent ligase [Histoplasma capsulatum H143]
MTENATLLAENVWATVLEIGVEVNNLSTSSKSGLRPVESLPRQNGVPPANGFGWISLSYGDEPRISQFTAAAAVAGVGALGAYLDGKYQLRRDAYTIHRMRRSERIAARAKAEGRLNVWYVFRNVVEKYPNALCVWSRTGSYTFREVLDISCQYGNYFLSIGVKRGRLVAFYLQNSPEFVFVWLGLWSIGCGPAMINYNLTEAGLIHCLKLSGADVIVVDADAECTARIHDQRNEIENDLKMHSVHNGAAQRMRVYYESDVYHDLPEKIYATEKVMEATGACILTGVSVAIAKKFSTSRFWKDIHDSKSIYVGETARHLLTAPPSPLDRGHNVRCMYGNGLRPDVWEKFKERGPYQSRCVGHHGAILRRLMHNVYIPVVIDPMTGDMYRDPKTGFATRAPYSEGGEIIISVPDESAFQGYWKNPDATAKKFVRDVFKKGDIYYRTGDALRRTDDGHWHFLDRLGDTFRWKSENVSTAEVATVLGEYPGVAEANVYGVSVPTHEGRAGCAAILIQPDQRFNFGFAAFARYARERLPKYAVPVFLRLVEASNHTHNQKQNKVPLRDEGVDPDKLGSKAREGKNDRFLWLLPQNDTYLEFGRSDWEDLVNGRVKL